MRCSIRFVRAPVLTGATSLVVSMIWGCLAGPPDDWECNNYDPDLNCPPGMGCFETTCYPVCNSIDHCDGPTEACLDSLCREYVSECGPGANEPACVDGWFCDEADGACRRKIVVGGLCETDSSCRTGNCVSERCVVDPCGNGILAGNEQCDDNDRVDDDGCSADCLIEHGWLCSGEPSECHRRIHVRSGAAPGGTGTDWQDAFSSLSVALSIATAGDEVWVAAGRHVPDGVDSTATFLIPSGVAVYGGFGGLEASPEERDWRTDASVLDGDRLGNDVPGDAHSNSEDNSRHVVTIENAGAGTVLDGFFVSGGRGWTPGDFGDGGGGMLIDASHVHVRNCVFEGNAANGGYSFGEYELDGTGGGGAILSANGSQVTIEDSDLRDNEVEQAYSGAGGALMSVDSSLDVTRCAFTNNLAAAGGAIAVDGGDVTIQDTELYDNESGADGGGAVFAQDAAVRLSRSELRANTAGTGAAWPGGGAVAVRWLYSQEASAATVTGCTFEGNSAACGGAISIVHASARSAGTAVISGSAFVGNHALDGASDCAGQGGALHSAGYQSTGQPEEPAHVTLLNSWFSGNTAGHDGGAVFSSDVESFAVSSSSFASNSPNALSATDSEIAGALEVNNSVLWGNGAQPLAVADVDASVSYSCVEGGWAGAGSGGNVVADPTFIDADGLDDVAGTEDDDLRLPATSPAVDAGSNDLVSPDLLDLDGDGDLSEPVPFDADGHARFADVSTAPDTGQGTPPVVDMGAFESSP